MKFQTGLFLGLTLMFINISYAQTLEQDAIPTYCHRSADSSPTENPCRNYSKGSYLNKSKQFLKLKMDSNAFEGDEKKVNKWIKNREVDNICFWQSGQWHQGTLRYIYSGSKASFDSSAGAHTVDATSKHLCNVGMTTHTSDAPDRVGPRVSSNQVTMGLYKSNGEDTQKRFYSYAGAKPSVKPFHVPLNCRRTDPNRKTDGDDNYLECNADNPNSEKFCHLRYFAGVNGKPTSKNFPYVGWWWVRGRTTGAHVNKNTEVCNLGITQEPAQDIADNDEKIVTLKNTFKVTNVAFTNVFAVGLYSNGDFTSVVINDTLTQPATGTNVGFRYSKVTKCYTNNPDASKKTWYTCKNSAKQQGLNKLLLTPDPVDATKSNATDANDYTVADHEEATADCIIRAPIETGMNISELFFSLLNRRYSTVRSGTNYIDGIYSTVDSKGRPVLNNAGSGVKESHSATYSSNFSLDTYGPFARPNTGAVAIVLADYNKNGTPVKVETCDQVEYQTTRKFIPSATTP